MPADTSTASVDTANPVGAGITPNPTGDNAVLADTQTVPGATAVLPAGAIAFPSSITVGPAGPLLFQPMLLLPQVMPEPPLNAPLFLPHRCYCCSFRCQSCCSVCQGQGFAA